MTVARELKVKASANLGGLGSTEGPATLYQWTPPSLIPKFFPWMGLLVLTLFRQNRSRQVLWLLLPLALSGGVSYLLSLMAFVDSQQMEMFSDIIQAAGMGLAGFWLLMPHLKRLNRFLTFLCVLLSLEASGLYACAVQQDWIGNERLAPMLIVVALLSAVFGLSIILTGWCCRHRYGPWRITLWTLLWIAVCWGTTLGILCLIGNPGPLGIMAAVLLVSSFVSFGLLLPFLILSFANRFFRDRLKGLLD